MLNLEFNGILFRISIYDLIKISTVRSFLIGFLYSGTTDVLREVITSWVFEDEPTLEGCTVGLHLPHFDLDQAAAHMLKLCAAGDVTRCTSRTHVYEYTYISSYNVYVYIYIYIYIPQCCETRFQVLCTVVTCGRDVWA